LSNSLFDNRAEPLGTGDVAIIGPQFIREGSHAMIRQLFKRRRKYVLIDVDTQKDFFLADGKACIRNHRRILIRIRRIMAWARQRKVPVISTCQVYPNNGNGNVLGYCIDGSEGQKKISYTLLANRTVFAADGNTDLPADLLQRYQQVILHKRCVDPFEEPRIERLLSELKAEEFILIGACAEEAVEATALGLLQRGKRVSVVVDALGVRESKEAKLALRKMEAKGGRLIETRKLAGSSHLKNIGICRCGLCRPKVRKAEVKIVAEQ